MEGRRDGDDGDLPRRAEVPALEVERDPHVEAAVGGVGRRVEQRLANVTRRRRGVDEDDGGWDRGHAALGWKG